MDYPIAPVEFTRVKVNDRFWGPRLDTNRRVTIPYDFAKCEATGRISNFARAAGREDGPHQGRHYNDSDVFKVIEGAAYALHAHPDPELDRYLDDLVESIAAAQEPDGYLYTARTIDPAAVDPAREGLGRWSNLRVSHELYNVGHLYDAAVAHYRATGKRSLLDVAIRSADLVDATFGPDRRRDVPGHQQIEMGLVNLFRVTGEPRYFDLARFFLDERGRANGRELYADHDNPGYMQDHLPVTEQEEAVGHAVRALYMYCAMADVAALAGDRAYLATLDTLWQDVVGRKTYLTGGVGARHRGEAFGDAYELPNRTAYAETCAAIASVMWNHRMFLLHGDTKYLDVLERTLYNGLLAGISREGDTFFYANPLASDGRWAFNHGEGCVRSPWFECSCCPTNLARFLASLPGYLYALEGDVCYVTQYVTGRADLTVAGMPISIEQSGDYPWDGRISLRVEVTEPVAWTLALRVPGWARGVAFPSDLYAYLDPSAPDPIAVTVNGRSVDTTRDAGFVRITHAWQTGDEVVLQLPMLVRRVIAHEAVEGNRGRVAVERGPVVYCAEGIDNGGTALELGLPDRATLTTEPGEAPFADVLRVRAGDRVLVPYFTWAHRGAGEMQLWLLRQP
jgi:uncharacterized protein